MSSRLLVDESDDESDAESELELLSLGSPGETESSLAGSACATACCGAACPANSEKICPGLLLCCPLTARVLHGGHE